MWQPTLTWEDAQRRAKVMSQVREFFYQRNIIEVETPVLSANTVTDVHLDSFSTNDPQDESKLLYLQTSPEFAMKRLLADGYQSIFQISKSFRFEEAGRYHNPEFTMLEWYRLNFNEFDLMDEVNELLVKILGTQSAEQLSYQRAFLENVGIDPLCCDLNTVKTKLLEYGISGDWIADEKDMDICLQVLFSEVIENRIGLHNPCFIYDFPSSQASLAKISQSDDRVASRFECYFKGVELANGFYELSNADEQLTRFKSDNLKRKQFDKAENTIDTRFIEALKHGLPDCSGVALGIDRLMMLALNKEHIESVLTFPINNA